MTQPKRQTRLANQTKSATRELDSIYLLKLVMYLIVGSFWVRISNSSGTSQIPIPVGLGIGLLFARQERFQIDRKIEYAVLLIAMFVGFWSQVGLYIAH